MKILLTAIVILFIAVIIAATLAGVFAIWSCGKWRLDDDKTDLEHWYRDKALDNDDTKVYTIKRH